LTGTLYQGDQESFIAVQKHFSVTTNKHIEMLLNAVELS
jgi:hypothetical protein